MENKVYLGVKFINGQNSVVPQFWVTEKNNKKYCFWPVDGTSVNVNQLSKEYKYPDSDNWKKYKVDVLVKSKTFSGCEKKLYTPGGFSTDDTLGEKINDDDCDHEVLFSSGFDVNSNRASSSCSCPCLNIVTETHNLVKGIELQLQNLSRICTTVLNIQSSRDSEPRIEHETKKHVVLAAARTAEELDKLVQHKDLVQHMKHFIGATSKETMTKILQSVMTKELALEYSYTGFNRERKLAKRVFAHHPIAVTIIENASELSMEESRGELIRIMKASLRAARDWYGRVKHHGTKDKDADQSIEGNSAQLHLASDDLEADSVQALYDIGSRFVQSI